MRDRYDYGVITKGNCTFYFGGYRNTNNVFGRLNDGFLYDSLMDKWTYIAGDPTVSPVQGPSVAISGSKLVVTAGFNNMGGPTNAIFDLVTEKWSLISTTNALKSPDGSSVFDGKILSWSYFDANRNYSTDHRVYDIASNTWSSASTAGVPFSPNLIPWVSDPNARGAASKISFFWSSNDGRTVSSQTWYNAETNKWVNIANRDGRIYNEAYDIGGDKVLLFRYHRVLEDLETPHFGAIVNLATGTMTPISGTGAPLMTQADVRLFTGTKLVIFQLDYRGFPGYPARGAMYDIATNRWTAISSVNAPYLGNVSRGYWNGSRVLLWTGVFGKPATGPGGIMFDPIANRWEPASPVVSASFSGNNMMLWTGDTLLLSGAAGNKAIR